MASAEGKRETVLVTGASGFIGSTLVGLLLDRGYNVHASVLNPDDKAETEHLLALGGGAGEGRLRVFPGDLLDGAALMAAARGCSGVFHLATPCTVYPVSDPQGQMVVPAVEGTLNILRAAKEARTVRRVVVTSSSSAIIPSPAWPAGEPRDERCWADVDYCKKNEVWYPVSKTLAEKAAWRFAEENGVDVVVVNPVTAMGPMIPPTINCSMTVLLRLLQGCTEEYRDIWMGAVHVHDAAMAHILVFEDPAASGRHICAQSISHWSDFAAKVAELYPEYKVPKFPKDTQPGLVRAGAEEGSKKLVALGLRFSPLEKIIRDAVEALKSRGYIS